MLRFSFKKICGGWGRSLELWKKELRRIVEAVIGNLQQVVNLHGFTAAGSLF